MFFSVHVFDNKGYFKQGAQAHCGYLCQRSYSTMGEAEIDHLRAPALSEMGRGSTQEPPQFSLHCSRSDGTVATSKDVERFASKDFFTSGHQIFSVRLN